MSNREDEHGQQSTLSKKAGIYSAPHVVGENKNLLDTRVPSSAPQQSPEKLVPLLWLIVAHPVASRGKILQITPGNIIGRQGDIQWDDPRMSRQHASFDIILDKQDINHSLFTLTPEKDRNGTLINGRRVKGQTVLHENDIIVMGETHFVVKVLK